MGFTVSLYARLPLDKAPEAERRADAAAIRERLAKIVQSLVPREGSRARVEIDPPRAAVVLESEGQQGAEVALYARRVPRRRLLRGGDRGRGKESLRRDPAADGAGLAGEDDAERDSLTSRAKERA